MKDKDQNAADADGECVLVRADDVIATIAGRSITRRSAARVVHGDG
jgi:hypothetical protein